VPVRIGTTAIEDADGNFIGYLEIIEDISRFKEMEREKKNFVSMVAHDMKSPMVIIGGFTKRLQKDPLCKDNNKIRKYLPAKALYLLSGCLDRYNNNRKIYDQCSTHAGGCLAGPE